MVKLLMERGANPHEKDNFGYTAFTESLRYGNTAITDYLFSRDDFALSNLMPRQNEMSAVAYKEYRKKAISRVSELVDEKGLEYARAVTADIAEILEKNQSTKEDIKALQPLAKKIASRDWVSDAQVSSDAFMSCEMER